MKFRIDKDKLLEKLTIASRFCLSKTNAIPSLQGGLLAFDKEVISITTTDLNDFFFSTLPLFSKDGSQEPIVVDIKKIVEFLQFLPKGEIEVETNTSQFIIRHNKTVGTFDVISSDDFPKLPSTTGTKVILTKTFLEKNLPLVLFSVSHDESRPILNGVSFISRNEKHYIVSTDGFRLSLIENTKQQGMPQATISSDILNELLHFASKEVEMTISDSEKVVMFTTSENTLITRLIEGDFPPFERVIPTSYKTHVVLDREDLLRNIKLSSVFAKDYSSIVVLEVKPEGIYIRPRVKEEKGTVIFQDAAVEGDEEKIAFNFKFLLDFLNNVKAKEVIFEMSASNAPGVFRTDDNKEFIHIIMPIRTEE